jgi:sugar/nucleoside kinase (ribokinase family)
MAENELELLCIGNALVDIFAQGEAQFDVRFGLNEKVQHISMEKMREILSALPAFSICSGGGSANVAKIAGLLGIETGFVGALGAVPGIDLETSDSGRTEKDPFDQFGQLFEEQLKEAEVHITLIQKNSPTGICLMLQMNDGEVKIAASPSAALELTENDLDAELIREAKVVVLDGFMLGRHALVHRILELAHKHGTVVALDVSSTTLVAERTAEILTYARAYPLIIFMNEDEAITFYQALSHTQEPLKKDKSLSPELVDLFRDFTSHDIFPILTVKLGNRGAIVFAGGNIYREETIPIIPLETTGAGDAFCAAFLAAWIRNKSLSECAVFGNKAAREALDDRGAQPAPKALKQLGKQLK